MEEKSNKKDWVQEIREKRDSEIEDMIGVESPFRATTDKRFDFAILELQRRVQVKNVEAVRELKESVNFLSSKLGDYREEAKKEGKNMLGLTIILGILAFLQLLFVLGQFELGWNQIESSQNQTQLQNAIWKYERMRNDRIEERDVEWRRQDLENFNKNIDE